MKYVKFHEHAEEVLFKIRLKIPTQTIMVGGLFMYVITNTNIAGITFIEQPFFIVLEIMLSAKSDVIGIFLPF